MPGRRMTGAQAKAVDASRCAEQAGGLYQHFQRLRLRELADLRGDAAQHVGRQYLVTLQLLAFRLCADAAGKARDVAAHGIRMALADILIAGEAEMFGKPRHGGGLHARLPCLFAHGEQRNLVRLVQHILRGGLKLLRHRVEGLDDLICERAGLHGDRIHLSKSLCNMCFICVDI